MTATEEQANELLKALRPLCTGLNGEADLRMGVDLLNGMLSRFYYDDPPVDLKIPVISTETVKRAIMLEDSLTVQHFIDQQSK